jgi:hypothetical protein
MSDEAEGELTPEEREEFATDVEWFARNIFVPIRRAVVRSLLAGNDACCFSAEQYRDAYLKYGREKLKFAGPMLAREGWEAVHLQSTGLVREAEPGVWVAICRTAKGV